MPEQQVQNVPMWILIIIAAGQLVSAIALVAIAFFAVKTIKEAVAILQSVQQIVQEDVRKEIMPSVAGTLRNVKTISDDAASTTHNVTATVNRVSNVVGSVTGRLESPLIKAVGMATGLFAAGRAMRGAPKETVVITEKPRKRRGFFG